jgi:hypothetical protein
MMIKATFNSLGYSTKHKTKEAEMQKKSLSSLDVSSLELVLALRKEKLES